MCQSCHCLFTRRLLLLLLLLRSYILINGQGLLLLLRLCISNSPSQTQNCIKLEPNY
jgi:hypothetical protein